MTDKNATITEKTWAEFSDAGLLWFVNIILHVFGWAIVRECDNNGEITKVYPARTTFRGFAEDRNTWGYQSVAAYLKDNATDLYNEAKEEL